MITKESCIKLFNAALNNTSISLEDDLIPLLSDYLFEVKCDKASELLSFIINNPTLILETIPTLIDYYTRKFNVCSIYLNKNNFKPFLYY